MTQERASAPQARDLSRCPHCGRSGTLTEPSANNTCVIVEPCEEARRQALAVLDHIEQYPLDQAPPHINRRKHG